MTADPAGEADDAALLRARVFVDTSAALTEGGDVAAAIRDGVLREADVLADLAATTLLVGWVRWRLGERFGWTDVVGSLIVAAGILLVQLARVQPRPAKDRPRP